MKVEEVLYRCKFDGSRRPAMCHFAEGGGLRPLVVALHTWSGDHAQASHRRVAELCAERNWNMVFPDFRGPNWRRDACGSELVVSDLEDAVEFMRSGHGADPGRVFLVGGSGGGHCALLMAGRRPDLWAAVSSWCPITDIAAWHRQCRGTRFAAYADHIERVCGGDPATSETAADEARKRSPLTWLPNARDLPLDINAGIHDGHAGSVPVSQAIDAYNLLAAPEDRISREDTARLVQDETVPGHLAAAPEDPAYGAHAVLLRRRSRNVRLTLFEGGHDILFATAFEWFDRQLSRERPDWSAGAKCREDADPDLAG